MTTKRHSIFLFLLTILLTTSCGDQTSKTINKNTGNSRFDFSIIENKFKYSDLAEFSIDTIQWDKRKDFYTKLDSLEFFQIYQDTAKKEYLGQYAESIKGYYDKFYRG